MKLNSEINIKQQLQVVGLQEPAGGEGGGGWWGCARVDDGEGGGSVAEGEGEGEGWERSNGVLLRWMRGRPLRFGCISG